LTVLFRRINSQFDIFHDSEFIKFLTPELNKVIPTAAEQVKRLIAAPKPYVSQAAGLMRRTPQNVWVRYPFEDAGPQPWDQEKHPDVNFTHLSHYPHGNQPLFCLIRNLLAAFGVSATKEDLCLFHLIDQPRNRSNSFYVSFSPTLNFLPIRYSYQISICSPHRSCSQSSINDSNLK
jgi:hypothetical protein